MKKIEIFGTGCAKCKKLEKNTKKAVKKLGIEAEIEKIEDIEEMSAKGVMTTPALAVDGEVKVKGKVPSAGQIKKLLNG